MSISSEELYDLSQAGRSYEILALQNDMTRSAVAGKIFRWKKKNNIASDCQPRKNRIYGEKTSNPAKKAEVKTTVVPLNIEMDHLKHSQCRYPYGDGPFTFCGHPVTEKSPYCEEHHKICFRKITPRQIKNSTNLGSW